MSTPTRIGSVTVDGVTFWWRHDEADGPANGFVTVGADGYGQKGTQLGGLTVEHLAKTLARELLREKEKGGSSF